MGEGKQEVGLDEWMKKWKLSDVEGVQRVLYQLRDIGCLVPRVSGRADTGGVGGEEGQVRASPPRTTSSASHPPPLDKQLPSTTHNVASS